MILTEKVSLYYPNLMGRILLLAIEEVIGNENIKSVLSRAGADEYLQVFPPANLDKEIPFSRLGQIMVSLEQLYGLHGGGGLALRAGRAAFKHNLRNFGPLMDFNGPAIRLTSTKERTYYGVKISADIFNRFTDQNVTVSVNPSAIYWSIESCPYCWNRSSDGCACHFVVGLLQDSLYWACGGRYFRVEEIECAAKGDVSCIFRIEKQHYD